MRWPRWDIYRSRETGEDSGSILSIVLEYCLKNMEHKSVKAINTLTPSFGKLTPCHVKKRAHGGKYTKLQTTLSIDESPDLARFLEKESNPNN